jgi:hypothetical protein
MEEAFLEVLGILLNQAHRATPTEERLLWRNFEYLSTSALV